MMDFAASSPRGLRSAGAVALLLSIALSFLFIITKTIRDVSFCKDQAEHVVNHGFRWVLWITA
jgi:hypothetical protein